MRQHEVHIYIYIRYIRCLMFNKCIQQQQKQPNKNHTQFNHVEGQTRMTHETRHSANNIPDETKPTLTHRKQQRHDNKI